MRQQRTQGLAPDFPAVLADLVPKPSVYFHGAITELTSQSDDLCDDQLSHTAGVGERGIEDGNALLGRVIKINLVRPDTEATYDEEVLRLAEDILGELRL
jgi:hypothetical protein